MSVTLKILSLKFQAHISKEVVLILLSSIIMLVVSPWFDNVDQFNVYSGFISLYYTHNLYSLYVYSYPPLPVYFDWIPLTLLHLFVPFSNWNSYSNIANSLAQQIGFLSPVVFAPLFNLAYKIPMIVSTVITAVLLLKIGKRIGLPKRKLDFFLTLYLFNPFIIYESAIHAPIDCFIPPLVTGFVYTITFRKPFAAGFITSIGIFTIIFPTYLLVLFAGFFVTQLILGGKTNWKNPSRDLLLFLAGVSLPVIILLPYLGNFIHLIEGLFVPGSTLFLSYSNTGIWGIFNSSFGILSTLGRENTKFFTLYISHIILLVDVFLFILVGVFIANNEKAYQRDDNIKLIKNCKLLTLSILILLIGLTDANPWGYLWFLPLLLIVALGNKLLTAIYIATSSWALIFEVFFLGGPIFNLFPLSIYTHVISAQTLVNLSLRFWNYFWVSHQHFLWNFSSLTGGILLLISISFVALSKTDRESHLKVEYISNKDW